MGMEGFGLVVLVLVWAVPILVLATILYWIIRLGVKHGLRAYYAEDGRGPGPGV